MAPRRRLTVRSVMAIWALGVCTGAWAQGAPACPTPPELPPSLGSVDYYTDAKHSVIDPELQKRSEEQNKFLRDALYALGRMAEGGDRPEMLATQACALGWMEAWARRDALERVDKGGTVLQVVSAASLSMAYRTALALGKEAPREHGEVNRWLEQLATSIARNEDVGRPGDQRNNVTYWAALAAYNTSVVTGNRALAAWSRDVYRQALSEIDEEGFFPSELKRGQQALRYQWFAVTPLVTLYVTSREKDGFRDERSRARLVKAITAARAGLTDTALISRRAGTKVDAEGVSGYALTRVTQRLADCVVSGTPGENPASLPRDWRLGIGFRNLRCENHFEVLGAAAP